MKNLVYTGESHFRELSTEDLAKAGVEDHKPLTFERFTPLEVSNALADAILAAPGIFGSFKEGDEIADLDAKSDGESKKLAATKKSTSTDTSADATSIPSGGAKTTSGTTAG